MAWRLGGTAGTALILIAGVVIAGCGSSDESGESARPFRATNAEVRKLVNDELGEGATRAVDCNRRTCVIHFKARDIYSRPERETLDQERPIWKKLWTDPQLKSAKLVAYNKVTSLGGKERIAPTHRLTCDRSAADQIDWDNVTTDGLKMLCNWVTVVR